MGTHRPTNIQVDSRERVNLHEWGTLLGLGIGSAEESKSPNHLCLVNCEASPLIAILAACLRPGLSRPRLSAPVCLSFRWKEMIHLPNSCVLCSSAGTEFYLFGYPGSVT